MLYVQIGAGFPWWFAFYLDVSLIKVSPSMTNRKSQVNGVQHACLTASSLGEEPPSTPTLAMYDF